ncbi:MAG: hypothetical protein V1827_01460 [Candidatus Micrarchaeota archaeon]
MALKTVPSTDLSELQPLLHAVRPALETLLRTPYDKIPLTSGKTISIPITPQLYKAYAALSDPKNSERSDAFHNKSLKLDALRDAYPSYHIEYGVRESGAGRSKTHLFEITISREEALSPKEVADLLRDDIAKNRSSDTGAITAKLATRFYADLQKPKPLSDMMDSLARSFPGFRLTEALDDSASPPEITIAWERPHPAHIVPKRP